MPIRLVIQGVDQVHLLVDNDNRYVRTGRGVIIYVAFIKDGNDQPPASDVVRRAVDALLDTKIFTHFSPETMNMKPQSLRECPAMDITLVPQASLGGKVKVGQNVQFHHLVDKNDCVRLYDEFCHEIRVARGVDEDAVDTNGAPLSGEVPSEGWLKYAGRVVSGTFGNRQGVRIESEGPFTHMLDI